MTTQHARRWAVAAALFGLVAVTGVVPAGADVQDVKQFTIDVDGTVAAFSGDPDVAVYSGAGNATITIVINNLSSQQPLGSANVTVPAPFVVKSAAADTVPGGPLLELRNLGIAAGSSRTFTIGVEVRSCAAGPGQAFLVDAKQSNDYNGNGNDIFLVTASSDRTVSTVGSCSLAFVSQPADAERDVAITSVDYEPAGVPISVEARDGGGTRISSFGGDVTLSANRGAIPYAVGSPTAPATSSGLPTGLAVFDLGGPTLAESASDYTLTAAATVWASALTSAPSPAFSIVGDAGNCTAQGCFASDEKGNVKVSADFGPGAANTLLVSVDPLDAPPFECGSYPRPAGQLVSQFQFATDDASRVGDVSIVIPSATRPLKEYEVCWAAPYSFIDKTTGLTAGTQGSVTKSTGTFALHVGLLPDCARRGTVVTPCVSNRAFDRTTKAVTLTVRAKGLDPWTY